MNRELLFILFSLLLFSSPSSFLLLFIIIIIIISINGQDGTNQHLPRLVTHSLTEGSTRLGATACSPNPLNPISSYPNPNEQTAHKARQLGSRAATAAAAAAKEKKDSQDQANSKSLLTLLHRLFPLSSFFLSFFLIFMLQHPAVAMILLLFSLVSFFIAA